MIALLLPRFADLHEFSRLLIFREDGLDALYRQNDSEHDQQRRDCELQHVSQRERPCCDSGNLAPQRHDQRGERDDEHEHHGDVEHLVILACIAQPCAHRKQAERCEQLVRRTEERPHELVASKTKTNTEHHRDDRCDPGVRDGFCANP